LHSKSNSQNNADHRRAVSANALPREKTQAYCEKTPTAITPARCSASWGPRMFEILFLLSFLRFLLFLIRDKAEQILLSDAGPARHFFP
jgi:hypothetical protein